ncbi:prepilin-type N-terminal cleavage/methylation domain-containing protein [Halarsenatibacter silvermanii]|uniref:Uncharacterized protein n=1 Tax=Halarsenatibacter silvermanii TaxID=321763 RepID=A0A1G9L9E0_9FIRM|nr:prepilin-type N-terminal cleavage/methylation domain-containing protein [Halarsenatibacter silvermanii]SDL58598.1 hypothetical protein SAMN04488692_1062 [Halarsenatibacter silvermanii]
MKMGKIILGSDIMLNNKGITLVEVILALSLVGIIGLMAAGIQTDIYEIFYTEADNTSFHINLQTMHQLFRDELVGMEVNTDSGDYSFEWNNAEDELVRKDLNNSNNDFSLRFQEDRIEEIEMKKDNSMLNITVKYNMYEDSNESNNSDNNEREYKISVYENYIDEDINLVSEDDKLYFEIPVGELPADELGWVNPPGEGQADPRWIEEFKDAPQEEDPNYHSGIVIFSEENLHHWVAAKEKTSLEAVKGFIFEVKLEVRNDGELTLTSDKDIIFEDEVDIKGELDINAGGDVIFEDEVDIKGELCFEQKTTVEYEGETEDFGGHEDEKKNCYDEDDFHNKFD